MLKTKGTAPDALFRKRSITLRIDKIKQSLHNDRKNRKYFIWPCKTYVLYATLFLGTYTSGSHKASGDNPLFVILCSRRMFD